MEPTCEYYLVHEEVLKRHTEELKCLSGLPQDMKNVLEMLKEIKDKNISKEVVDLKIQNLESRVKLWMTLTVISGVSSGILMLVQLYKLIGGNS